MYYLYFYAKILILLVVICTVFENNPLLYILRTPQNLKWFHLLVAGLAIWVGSRRETYLPFLGKCVLPHTVLKTGTNVSGDKLIETTISAPKALQIVWWASKPSDEIQPVMKAYDDYMNSGVVNVENDIAKIAYLCPQRYKVKGRTLKKHIHYREVDNSGMMGAIKTIYVDC